MPRPSIKSERKEEILQAYERCMALYGVEGATQKRIAEEAGIARPLLRHHVGNNEELLLEAARRYAERCKVSMQELADYPFSGLEGLLDVLFLDNSDVTSPADTMIATGLIVVAQTDERIKAIMSDWFDDIQNKFEQVLTGLFPSAEKEEVASIASGLIGIYFNLDALFPIKKGDVDFQKRSYRAARILLMSLNSSTGDSCRGNSSPDNSSPDNSNVGA